MTLIHKTCWWIGILMLFAMSSSGCAPKLVVTRMKPAELNMPNVKSIALLDFQGRDGDNLYMLIEQDLVSSERYEVVDRTTLRNVEDEIRIALDGKAEDGDLEIGKLVTADALVTGRVGRAAYKETMKRREMTCTRTVGEGDNRKTVKYKCTQYIRQGVASYRANLRVVHVESGRVLATRPLSKELTVQTKAIDEDPRGIDGEALLDASRRDVATQFIHMIAPYPVQESIKLVQDSKLPEITTGNGYAKMSDWATAMEHYAKAVARADSDTELSPKTKGKAHYSLGLALAFAGDFDTGLEELQKAYSLHQSSSWLQMIGRVKKFKQEAEKLEDQMAEAQASS